MELRLLHLTKSIHKKTKETSESQSRGLSTDPVVMKLASEYHYGFSGLGKHKRIMAKLIVNEIVYPVAHKQRRIPYNLDQKVAQEEQPLRELGIFEAVPDRQPTT